MQLNRIKIHDKFKLLLPVLTQSEKQELTDSILKDGCREPLVIWNGVLIDGHNRFDICTEHDIDFKTVNMEFEDEQSAMDWIDQNQLGRRNLSPDAFKLALGRRYNRIRQNHGGQIPGSSGQNVHSLPKTADKLSTEHAVSEKTVRRAGKFAEEVERKPEYQKAIQNNVPIKQVEKQKKQAELEKKKEIVVENLKKSIEKKPVIVQADYKEFLKTVDDFSIDLLITDPPYKTDIADIDKFVNEWMPFALSKVKDTGRAYICCGAYPEEQLAYLNYLINEQDEFNVDTPLIWTYQNTIGPTPKNKYKLNYQVILHLYRDESRELDCPIMLEQFSVKIINAPDGRLGNRFHAWQKPDELGEMLIRHSTKENDKVLDCFAGTGTFLLMAAKLNRNPVGCEIDKLNLDIAVARGCVNGTLGK